VAPRAEVEAFEAGSTLISEKEEEEEEEEGG